MKNLRRTALAGVILAASGVAAENPAPEMSVAYSKPYRLLDAMHELQRYSTKLYFAGVAKNGEFASWYSWKVNQIALNIQERRTEPYAYNEWDAAELARMLESPIAGINETIENEQWKNFEGVFDALMGACNACHTAAEHAFIVVRAPKGEQAPLNQKFEK